MRRAGPVAALAALAASAGLPGCTDHAAPAAAPQAATACGDLLAEVGRKPQGLVFIGCAAAPERQGRPLRATYRVAGAAAARVEAALVRTAGLLPLRRSCCQWDGPAGGFVDAAGRSYLIAMTSDETTVTDRRAWRAIPAFAVVVDRFTEEI